MKKFIVVAVLTLSTLAHGQVIDCKKAEKEAREVAPKIADNLQSATGSAEFLGSNLAARLESWLKSQPELFKSVSDHATELARSVSNKSRQEQADAYNEDVNSSVAVTLLKALVPASVAAARPLLGAECGAVFIAATENEIPSVKLDCVGRSPSFRISYSPLDFTPSVNDNFGLNIDVTDTTPTYETSENEFGGRVEVYGYYPIRKFGVGETLYNHVLGLSDEREWDYLTPMYDYRKAVRSAEIEKSKVANSPIAQVRYKFNRPARNLVRDEIRRQLDRMVKALLPESCKD